MLSMCWTFGPFVRDYETERLFLCCVVRSRFDPFEVCPGVGTVVTAVVACARYGVPCYGTGLLAVSVLVPCGSSPGGRVPVATVEHRRLHARQVSCIGWPADVRSGKVTASHIAFRSRRRATSRSQLICVFKEPQPNRAGRSSAWPGEAAGRVSWRFKVLVEFSMHSRREDVMWSGGNAEGSPVFTFFAKSRFDPFEVCPGVGTVVTAVVACGVPEWWHNFDYGWYLYPVWVMVCGGTSYTSLF
ncbi:hypothetical protein Taro_014405 [Colocasia esculenta]|uniref:Uncharacterized protein n=1 Tax=Colocasia esculenta TaxID=4460 RepID=A0A843UIQ5_COLES|nr:hypothetical protein [Colocasia esculenta]